MKIRNGFVSNSSSTSFLIEVTKDESCPHCHKVIGDNPLLERIRHEIEDANSSGDNHVRAEGIDNIRKYMGGWCDEGVAEIIHGYKEKKDTVLLYLEISRYNDGLQDFIRSKSNVLFEKAD